MGDHVEVHRGAGRKRWQRPQCQIVDVDGEAVLVRGQGPFTDRDREAIADLIRAVRRRLAAEGDDGG